MSDIITALKRLERAGSEDSRETQKLLKAAGLLSGYIAELLPPEAECDGRFCPLPRNYSRCRLPDGSYTLTYSLSFVNHDHLCPNQSRDAATKFARDIATGWISELVSWFSKLADWREARTAGSAEAGATLRRAAEAMR